MAKKVKSGIKSKQINKHALYLVIESAAKELYSFRNSLESILNQNGMIYYFNDDYKTGMTLFFDYLLSKSSVANTTKVTITEILNNLLDLPQCDDKNKKAIWDDIAEQTKRFTKKIPELEYHHIVRGFYESSKYSYIFTPVWILLDYVYYPDETIFGETNKDLIHNKMYFEHDGIKVPIPLCCVFGTDVRTSPSYFTVTILNKYMLETGVIHSEKTTLKDNYYLYCYAAYIFIKSNVYFNKFAFENIPPMRSNIMSEHFLPVSDITFNNSVVYNNIKDLLRDIPSDILTNRKHTFANSFFSNIDYYIFALNDNKDFSVVEIISNVKIEEKKGTAGCDSYNMIYLTYSHKRNADFERTIPIIADNFLLTYEGFDMIDIYVFILLLCLYDVISFIPINIKNDKAISLLLDKANDVISKISSP